MPTGRTINVIFQRRTSVFQWRNTISSSGSRAWIKTWQVLKTCQVWSEYQRTLLITRFFSGRVQIGFRFVLLLLFCGKRVRIRFFVVLGVKIPSLARQKSLTKLKTWGCSGYLNSPIAWKKRGVWRLFFWLGPKEPKVQDLISFLTLRQSPKS